MQCGVEKAIEVHALLLITLKYILFRISDMDLVSFVNTWRGAILSLRAIGGSEHHGAVVAITLM